MSACEKCWTDAAARALVDTTKTHTAHYYDLLRERPRPCGEGEPLERLQRLTIERDEDGLPVRLWINPRARS